MAYPVTAGTARIPEFEMAVPLSSRLDLKISQCTSQVSCPKTQSKIDQINITKMLKNTKYRLTARTLLYIKDYAFRNRSYFTDENVSHESF